MKSQRTLISGTNERRSIHKKENEEMARKAGRKPRGGAGSRVGAQGGSGGASGLWWLGLTPEVHMIRLPRPQLTGHEVITDQG